MSFHWGKNEEKRKKREGRGKGGRGKVKGARENHKKIIQKTVSEML